MTQQSQPEQIIIKNALISDPNSKHNDKKVDILIVNGVIDSIGKQLKEPFGSIVISGKDLVVSPGWLDLHVNIPDPGFEYKEDLDSALNAASSGGFTSILSCSKTEPTIDGKSGVEYQLKKSKGHLVDLHVAGSLSKGQEGHELSEMFDMKNAGAKAFYDFKSSVANTQLLKLALLYSKSFDGLIMIHPSDDFLTEGSVVNEGVMSTKNGLNGMPSIAEEIAIERALKLVEYTEQKIHFTAISTIEGLELIKKAKKKGLNITTGVCVSNLLYSESVLENFDTNFKLKPPLRDEKTRKALLNAVSSGLIDVVISDHWPQNIESKDCEFEMAGFGMNTLESAYGMLKTAMGDKLDNQLTTQLMALQPRKILNIDPPSIEVGKPANCTVFEPNTIWTFNLADSLSLSRNTSLNGTEFTGKVKATINNNKCFINK